jgi:hypothetical protein
MTKRELIQALEAHPAADDAVVIERMSHAGTSAYFTYSGPRTEIRKFKHVVGYGLIPVDTMPDSVEAETSELEIIEAVLI